MAAVLSIGMLTYSTKPRGSVVVAACLAEALSRTGHDVTLYALGKSGSGFYRSVDCRLEVIAAREAPPSMEELIRQRTREFVAGLERLGFSHDIAHAQDCLSASGLLAARARGSMPSPLVRTVHHVESFDNPYLAACQTRSILEVDAAFSVSRMTQQAVLDKFARPTALVHNGVDPARFAPQPSARAWAAAKFGIRSGDALIVSVGGVEPRKNTRGALQAVARVYARIPNLSFIIAGDHSIWDHSEYGARFDADLASFPAELSARVTRAGTLREGDMTKLYQAADVLLCTSHQEGFGLSVLEAMAAGVAVVVPGREPFTEYLDERTAVFVDTSSNESVAHGISSLLLDPRHREALGAAAKRRALDFSWGRAAEVHRKLYEEVLRSRHKEPSYA